MFEKAQIDSYEPLPDSEPVTDPARIVGLLKQLSKHHTLISVEIPAQPGQYTSSIVEVDRRHVQLDGLVPASGHQLLLAEGVLRITGKLDGIDIQFITVLEGTDNCNDVITYRVKLPERLDYRQRRSNHRAHIPLAQVLRVLFENTDGTLIEGSMHDLSRSGAGMIFPAGTPAVEPGLLHECAMELPDNTRLYCTVELRHANNLPTNDRQLIGARFVGLSAVQSRLVGQCVSDLERELIRKRTPD